MALITGASTGIGRATAFRFLAEGARVALMSRRKAQLDAAVRELGDGEAVLAVNGDVALPADVERVMASTLEHFGRLDICVSNAGIHRVTPFLQVSDREWDELLDINLRGTFLVCRAAARAMRDAAARDHPGGSIVVVGSTNSLVAEPGMAAYNASKGGLLMLARSMAVDLAPYSIRVNLVAPGTIKSEITRPMIEAGFAFGSIPLGRVGEAEEVADAIVYLASDEASYVTGTVLVVDGGQTALNGDPATS